MTPWVLDWENQAQLRPDAVAVIDQRGQSHSFVELQARAWSLEHRLRVFGLDSGDRLEIAWGRQCVADIVVAMWACGLRNATWSPRWIGFTKQQYAKWNLREFLSPRMSIDLMLGCEEVFARPGPGSHDTAILWPERSLEGAGRTACPVVLRPITHDQLTHAVSSLTCAIGLAPGNQVGWMDGGLCGLSWLVVIASLSAGACLIQCPQEARKDPLVLGNFLSWHDITWLSVSRDWAAQAGAIPSSLPSGILAPWASASPPARSRWSAGARWIEAWCPAACGWWWGCVEVSPRDDRELSLSQCSSQITWKTDKSGQFLLIEQQDSWLPVARVSPTPDGGVRFCLSSAVARETRESDDRVVERLRQHGRFGAVVSWEKDGTSWFAVQARCPNEVSDRVVMGAVKWAKPIRSGAARKSRWIAVDFVAPLDESGNIDPSSILGVG